MRRAKMIEAYVLADRRTAWKAAIEFLPGPFLPGTLLSLAVIAMLLADEGAYEWAVEMLSLALNHPASPRGLLENWPLLSRKRERLQAQLDSEEFSAAWERGAALDLQTVIAQLLEENAGVDS